MEPRLNKSRSPTLVEINRDRGTDTYIYTYRQTEKSDSRSSSVVAGQKYIYTHSRNTKKSVCRTSLPKADVDCKYSS